MATLFEKIWDRHVVMRRGTTSSSTWTGTWCTK